MEIENKKSILATFDEIIGNLRYNIDGMSEERTREFYINEGFRVVTNEWTEPGIGKQDNLNDLQ